MMGPRPWTETAQPNTPDDTGEYPSYMPLPADSEKQRWNCSSLKKREFYIVRRVAKPPLNTWAGTGWGPGSDNIIEEEAGSW